MAKAKVKNGVMVKVVAKSPITHNGDDYAIGDTLEIDESGLQQLLDVSAAELHVPDADLQDEPVG